jgi:hypothetical protein
LFIDFFLSSLSYSFFFCFYFIVVALRWFGNQFKIDKERHQTLKAQLLKNKEHKPRGHFIYLNNSCLLLISLILFCLFGLYLFDLFSFFFILICVCLQEIKVTINNSILTWLLFIFILLNNKTNSRIEIVLFQSFHLPERPTILLFQF